MERIYQINNALRRGHPQGILIVLVMFMAW